MLELRLVEELRALRKRHALKPTLPSMRCVGTGKRGEYLGGEIGKKELRDRGVFATAPARQAAAHLAAGMEAVRSFDCTG